MATLLAESYERVYQFNIFFSGIKPMIWRRFQVPETYAFWELHVAIQDMLGWQNKGLHQFYVQSIETKQITRIGLLETGRSILPFAHAWGTMIRDYFNERRKRGHYFAPFTREWHLRMELEKILPREGKKSYPICLEGEGNAPPQMCDEADKESFFDRISFNRQCRRYRRVLKYLGDAFDPKAFDKDLIVFSDPKKEFKQFGIEIKKK